MFWIQHEAKLASAVSNCRVRLAFSPYMTDAEVQAPKCDCGQHTTSLYFAFNLHRYIAAVTCLDSQVGAMHACPEGYSHVLMFLEQVFCT